MATNDCPLPKQQMVGNQANDKYMYNLILQ